MEPHAEPQGHSPFPPLNRIGLFITTHDAMHGTIAMRHRRLNDFLGKLAISLFAWFDYNMLHKKVKCGSQDRYGRLEGLGLCLMLGSLCVACSDCFDVWLCGARRAFLPAQMLARQGALCC